MSARILRVGAFAFTMLAALMLFVFAPFSPRAVTFPNGKRFAFSIVDDTDLTTLARVRPIYDLLDRYRILTTKTTWIFESTQTSHSPNLGDSLRNPAYREFLLDLQRRQFEIALHGVRGGSSPRAEVASGLEEFRTTFGAYPRMHINHSLNQDNLYWGAARFSIAPFRWAGGLRIRHKFSGEDPQSPHFWGDLAKERIEYVRQFTYHEINLLTVSSSMPYRLADKGYVNYWFPTSHGSNLDAFEALLSTENLDRLEREGGVCLVYAHLGSGSFSRDGGVNPRFEARIKDLAARNGWFAPASDILDHLKRQPGWTGEVPFRHKVRMEAKFILGQLVHGVD